MSDHGKFEPNQFINAQIHANDKVFVIFLSFFFVLAISKTTVIFFVLSNLT